MLIILVILGSAFYWYEYRPSSIKKECHSIAVEAAIKKANPQEQQTSLPSHEEIIRRLGTQPVVKQNSSKFNRDDYDTYYKMCLQKMGL